MATPTKDRITCHVLDTSAGRPAKGVRVQLSTATPPSPSAPGAAGTLREFESMTDDDGRVKAWLPYSSATASGEVPVYTLEDVLGGIQGPRAGPCASTRPPTSAATTRPSSPRPSSSSPSRRASTTTSRCC
ncbi:uncharacterized protein ColSpa_09251 [Colletotrichum spaethianum]|uniref:Transthyretin/hydroxyisourate hydrolase domain-containing protein n=1 Tax=Colletotrichum spaethianum TaxID=700344 RepID=A0AA37PB85_9PEZI|nr:uncharacterized protein ColSpa_09251 [Colletotrichum spaethianum]GKT49070.1 hypothetical protein ColSpa_09251 [Colletotrichum spaethianum]